ncbi:hypothetical protein Golax_000473 [Gossypium laxum]|uniref:RNase H type-1 domain-containing protein n=1 Tax=Gossypium laxum TaxID=34288 RepID=A0A7J9AU81_9ROSI|nr:hypothetical protein [Gossypium laxum]
MLSWEELIGNAYLGSLSGAFRRIRTSTSFRPSRPIVIPLPNSWISLNTDGSVRAKDAFAATSGILRDQSGLKLALDGKRVLIQTDSLDAVNIIQVSDRESSNLALVMRIHSLLKLLSH